jgi:hypothetical protein
MHSTACRAPTQPAPVKAQPPIRPPAPRLFARLLEEGYAPGAPPTLTAWCLQIDQGLARRSLCPICRCRGLDFRPFHKGRLYRIVCCCLGCGYEEER